MNSETNGAEKGSSSEFRAKLGSRLRQIESLFRNRQEAADAAKIGKSTLQAWIEGRSDPSFEGLSRLCAATGFSLDWLATGEGPMRGEAAPPSPPPPAPAAPQEAPDSGVKLKLWKKVAGATLEALRKEWLLRETTPESFIEVVDALVDLQIEDIGGLPPDIDNWQPDIKRYRKLIAAAGRT